MNLRCNFILFGLILSASTAFAVSPDPIGMSGDEPLFSEMQKSSVYCAAVLKDWPIDQRLNAIATLIKNSNFSSSTIGDALRELSKDPGFQKALYARLTASNNSVCK